jgi:ketosteroid isomerase-like protein
MSQTNVELAKRGIEAFNRPGSGVFAALMTADVELFPPMHGSVEGGGYRGREGFEAYRAELSETWDERRLIAEEFRDLGNRVLVVCRTELRGKGSGVPITARQTIIFDFRDGRICRFRGYLDHGEALRAAGLPE